MTEELIYKPKHRKVMDLQLTAMVDIFSMIIIFLIKGTMFTTADIVIPSEIQLPKSFSKEELESTPKVTIYADHVEVSFLDQPVKWDDWAATGAKILEKSEQLKKDLKKKDLIISLVADKKTPYKKIFDVSKVLKESGFDSVLFLANSNKGAGE